MKKDRRSRSQKAMHVVSFDVAPLFGLVCSILMIPGGLLLGEYSIVGGGFLGIVFFMVMRAKAPGLKSKAERGEDQ